MFAASLSTLKKRASELVKGADDFRKKDEELGPPSYEAREVFRSFVANGDPSQVVSDGPMVVRYEVQNADDGDRDGAAFPLPIGSATGITMGHLRSHFPVPGRYHFRFKAPTPDNSFGGFVWIDMVNDTEFVPIFRSEIYMKALRIPAEADPLRVLEPLPGGGLSASFMVASPPPPQQQWQPPPGSPVAQQSPVSPAFQQPPSFAEAASPPPASATPVPQTPSDLMVMDEEGELSSPTVARGTFSSPATATSGATAGAATATPPPPPQVFDRQNLVEKREAWERQQVVDAAARQAALQKKVDALKNAKVVKNNEIGLEMDRWAKTPDGQAFKDIKVLLSTLHTVTWPDSGWKELPLSELITGEGNVKKWYRKAILVVHPDKQTEADTDQQVRADRIFQALNEAFKLEDTK